MEKQTASAFDAGASTLTSEIIAQISTLVTDNKLRIYASYKEAREARLSIACAIKQDENNTGACEVKTNLSFTVEQVKDSIKSDLNIDQLPLPE